MKKFCFSLFSLALIQASIFAADAGLLSLVMPDAKVVAGVQVAQAKVSPFGQYLLSRMQPDDANFQQFISASGFDPRRDLNEIVMASTWQSDTKGQWLILAKGIFNPQTIATALEHNGGTVTSFQGVNILSGSTPGPAGTTSVIAFLDATRAIMGDADSVKATIQRAQTGAGGFSAPAKISQVSGLYDFWFVTLVPLSEFSGVMPDQNLNQAMQGNLFQAVLQASGGAKLGPASVMFGAEALTRSDKDASALADVVRFIAGMLQTNKGKNATATEVSALIDTINVQATGSTMTMSLTVPEAVIEQILQSATTRQHAAAAPARHQ